MRPVRTPAHERRALLIAFAVGVLIGLAAIWDAARAAKVTVSATTPSENTDGSPLLNLDHLSFEWGDCVASSADPSGYVIGAVKGHLDVPVTATGVRISTTLYPAGLARVCLDATAVSTTGQQSAPSNTAVWSAPATPAKPVTLGKPIQLPASAQSSSSSSASAQAPASTSTH